MGRGGGGATISIVEVAPSVEKLPKSSQPDVWERVASSEGMKASLLR